jgi:hypothetical protein
MNEVGAADQDRDLSVLFQKLGFAVFDYRRLHFVELSQAQRDELEDRAGALLDVADSFTDAAIAAAVNSVQDSLDRIRDVTTEAKESLKTLNNVQEAFAIVSAGLSLAGAVASGNAGGVVSGLQALVAAVHPQDGAKAGSEPT